jgi:hypothetical protein
VVPVEELVAFAGECWPGFERLPEFQGLRVRKFVGVKAMPYLQPLVLTAVADKGRDWVRWQSWRRRGF